MRPLACASVLVACTTLGDGDDDGTVSGELGRGKFRYECDSSTRACTEGAATVFPTRVAVDTRFGLSFEPHDDTVRLDTLQPASEQLLEKRDYAWRALRPGTVGIMSLPESGRLEDYTFITLEQAAAVRLYVGPKGLTVRRNGSGSQRPSQALDWTPIGESLALTTGAGVPLVAEPVAADGDALAGEPLIDFVCDAGGIVELVRPGQRPDWFSLVGAAAGSTRCTLGALGYPRSFDVVVTDTTEPPDPADSGSAAGPDADRTDARAPL